MSIPTSLSPSLIDLALSAIDDEPDHLDTIRRWCSPHSDDALAHETKRRRVAKIVADAITRVRDETTNELAGARAAADDAHRNLDDRSHSAVEAQVYLDACRRVESLERTLGLRE